LRLPRPENTNEASPIKLASADDGAGSHDPNSGAMIAAASGDGANKPDSKQRKKRSKMQPGDEIVRYYRDAEGKMKKVVKRVIKETVYLT